MTSAGTSILSEIHTSHLTEACQRKAQLTAEGKRIGEMPSALYFGLLWHEACGMAHLRGEFQIPKADAIIVEAHKLVLEKGKAENRPMTDAVLRDVTEHQANVSRLLGFYGERCASLVKSGRVLGVEVPVRMTLEVDGEPVEFASHVDLLWINAGGELEIWDWKTTEDDPSPGYLDRNLQMGLYWLAGFRGSFYYDGFWNDLEMVPRMTWVQVRNLAPYGRKTTGKDDNGNECEFAKGEHRPLSRILRTAHIEDAASVIEEISVRVRMWRAGLFPTNPTPDGCRMCECWRGCPSFQGDKSW